MAETCGCMQYIFLFWMTFALIGWPGDYCGGDDSRSSYNFEWLHCWPGNFSFCFSPFICYLFEVGITESQ